MQVFLERIDPQRHMCRFYRVWVEPSLFGDWVVVREWGRIGHHSGQRREQWFEEPGPAQYAARQIVRRKKKRGYIESNSRSLPKILPGIGT